MARDERLYEAERRIRAALRELGEAEACVSCVRIENWPFAEEADEPIVDPEARDTEALLGAAQTVLRVAHEQLNASQLTR